MWNEVLRNPDKLKKITQTAFRAIDYNNNGQIEMNELASIMKTTSEDLSIECPSNEEIKEVMKDLDQGGKGYLSEQDFSMLTEQVIKLINKN